MVELYKIDSEKNITPFDGKEAVPPIVFSISTGLLREPLGSSRIQLDLAHHISELLPVSPVFISHSKGDAVIEDMAALYPESLIIAINPNDPKNLHQRRSSQILTIGIRDLMENVSEIEQCDIGFYPSFRKERAITHHEPAAYHVAIDYDYLPSRLRADQSTQFLSDDLKTRNQDGQTVAVYIRSPDIAGLKELLGMMNELYEKHQFRFLITNGHCTDAYTTYCLAEFTRDHPQCEFFDYAKYSVSPDGNNMFKNFFDRADSVIVPIDTISTASDALHTGKNVFVFMTDETRRYFETTKYPREEHIFHRTMMAQGRIHLLSVENITSGLVIPHYHDDWGAFVTDRIIPPAREKLSKLTARNANPFMPAGIA